MVITETKYSYVKAFKCVRRGSILVDISVLARYLKTCKRFQGNIGPT